MEILHQHLKRMIELKNSYYTHSREYKILDMLVNELNEQLRQSNVVRQSEQLVICKKCGSSQMYQYTKIKDKCEDCGNIQDY